MQRRSASRKTRPAVLSLIFLLVVTIPRQFLPISCDFAVLRSWKQAHEATKSIESQLKTVISEGGSAIKELDEAFLKQEPTYKSGMRDVWEDNREKLADGVEGDDEDALSRKRYLDEFDQIFAPPKYEVVMPDPEEEPPLLAGELAASASIVGKYTSLRNMCVPSRIPREQFLNGVGDDEGASAQENALWKESQDLLLETLEPLWRRAEGVVDLVASAEQRAEIRRVATVASFRARVLKQMNFAQNQLVEEAELERVLKILQTDKRLLGHLAMLERCTLEAEDAQRRVEAAQKAYEQVVDVSTAGFRLNDVIEEGMTRCRTLDGRMRACMQAADTLPGQQDAIDSVGKFFQNLNPFR